ncbi:MAG TPA: polyprenyl synthetase family protein [Gemmatimonadales bacterium]|nr:polyprenyl synthetase family protein [Gemmatimonadales bacterium]
MRILVDAELRSWGAWASAHLRVPVGHCVAYALESPGKRLRPALVMATYRALGGEGSIQRVAAAVEVVHCYSLVHDDLPCMDDDDLRRGRPTAHKRFGVRTATEAGQRMIPLAGRVLADGAAALGLSLEQLGRLARELYRAAGPAGMVGGQYLDLLAEGQELTLDDMVAMHRRKTGALIAASAVLGALAAGADGDMVAAARGYGEDIGLAFQITDDLLDETGTSAELGKTAGKDARRRKPTFATLMNPDQARQASERCVMGAVDRLREARIDSSLLNDLAYFIINRRS